MRRVGSLFAGYGGLDLAVVPQQASEALRRLLVPAVGERAA